MEKLTRIEQLTAERLHQTYDQIGDQLWSRYILARKEVLADIASNIGKYEPNLTDHGPAHIIDVLENAYSLLGQEACSGNDSKTALNANELYFLVLSILFHDLGNIFGRAEHNKRIDEAYNYAFNTSKPQHGEQKLLRAIVEAHCGQTRDGSKDTIRKLGGDVFLKSQLDSQRVAAILRLADELAEGRQRTSVFVQTHFETDPHSQVYHDYAAITEITIDRPNERLVIKYEIDINPPHWNFQFDENRLRKLLDLCDVRAIKLDLERKYNRHYCSLLRPFKKTEISYHFHCKGKDLGVEIPNIVLDDLILPSPTKMAKLADSYKELLIDDLLPRLRLAADSFKK